MGKTQCLICHGLPIVPLSSGDRRALPTQPQEAEPLLETEGGNTEGGAPGLGRLSQALEVTKRELIKLIKLSCDKGASGMETVYREILGDFLEKTCGTLKEKNTGSKTTSYL